MDPFWQTVLVLALVLAAFAYLARAAWGVVAQRKAGECAVGCHSCPVPRQTGSGHRRGAGEESGDGPPASGGFVSLDELLKPPRP